MRATWLGGLLVLSSVLGAGALEAATFSEAYLPGRWTTGDAERCGKPEHEHTVFRADGTFATERNGAAVAVGFWNVAEDRLEMEVLASAAAVEPALQQHFDDGFGYVHIKALVFDVEDDAFRMVQSVGDTLQGLDVKRCPEPAARP